jgi:hypothetical protein
LFPATSSRSLSRRQCCLRAGSWWDDNYRVRSPTVREGNSDIYVVSSSAERLITLAVYHIINSSLNLFLSL